MDLGQPKVDCANFFIDDDVCVFDEQRKGKLVGCKLLRNHVRAKSCFKFCDYRSGLRCQFGMCKDYQSRSWKSGIYKRGNRIGTEMIHETR